MPGLCARAHVTSLRTTQKEVCVRRLDFSPPQGMSKHDAINFVFVILSCGRGRAKMFHINAVGLAVASFSPKTLAAHEPSQTMRTTHVARS